MKKKIIALAMALGFAFAAPASAGNGTSNFYLAGSCNPNTFSSLGFGVNFKVTNWDSGANQVYHLSWTRSGVAYSVKGIYLDGVYKGISSDFMVNVGGWGRHTWTLKDDVLGQPSQCSVYI
jgi:hypothetical protein